jgi:hypothetical protein
MAMRAPHLTSSEAIRMGEAMRIVANSSVDSHEGLTAAAERRRPRWRGR